MARDTRANCHWPETRVREGAHCWQIAKPSEESDLRFVGLKFDIDLSIEADLRVC
ncbi:hypothetical protein [Phaeobacter sp. NW0010-22]|uniref:hypothetical protein n=1 Tax=Phaeobacter sp. NW0010-22 TaxID=3135907 RepID=UPI003107ECF5